MDIYRVDPTRSAVQTYPASDPVIVSGDVGSALPLAGAGVLTDRLPVLSGDPHAPAAVTAPHATWAITDGNQRRAVSFGTVRYNESYLLGPNQQGPTAHYDVPLGFSVVPGSTHETTEVPDGASSVSASSFGATPIVNDPSGGPAGAFDGNPRTAWEADARNNSVGQWVAMTFNKALRFPSITVTPQEGSPYQPTITRVEITTDKGSVFRDLPPGKGSYTLDVAGGATRNLKLTIAAARPPALPPLGGIVLGAGITNVSIPGVSFTPRMRLPNDESAAFAAPRANAPVVVLARPLSNDNLTLGLVDTDDPDMSREFSIPKAETASVSGYAVPQPGTYLDSLIRYLSHVPAGSLQVSASSTLGGLPLFSTANLIDGSVIQPWIAAPGDRSPSLLLSWAGRRKVSSLSLTLSKIAARPTEVSITPAGGRPTLVAVPRKGGTVSFPPVVTDSLRVRFVGVAARAGVTPGFGVGLNVPVGLAQISVPGLVVATAPAPDSSEKISLPCGAGPTMSLDGKTEQSTVSGTIGDLIDLEPMHYTVCSGSRKGTELSAGPHTFSSEVTAANFAVTTAVIQPVTSAAPVSPRQRTATVVAWAAENRSVKIGAGPATYLVLGQNYNQGWTAHLGNVALKPIRVDGWEQGYLIPSGKGGVVTLAMHPDMLFRFLLALGGALLLALLALALVRARRISPDTGGPRRPLNFWLLLGLSGFALVLVSGPLALVLLPLLFVARRWGPGWMGVVAFGAFVTAGVFAAAHPAMIDLPGAGAFGRPAQIASVVALASVLIALVTETRMEGPRETGPESPPIAHEERA